METIDAPAVEVVSDVPPDAKPTDESAPKRKRGRPPGSKNGASKKASAQEPMEPPTEDEMLEASMAVGMFSMLVSGLGEKWAASTEKHAPQLMHASIRIQRAYKIQLTEKQLALTALGGALTMIAKDAGAMDQFNAWIAAKMDEMKANGKGTPENPLGTNGEQSPHDVDGIPSAEHP